MHERIGEHFLWHLPVLGDVHADTIMTTWLVMIVSLVFFGWVGATYRSKFISRRQTVVEAAINYIADLASGTLGEKGEPFVPFFIALFFFIFLLNQFGIFPFKAVGLTFGGSLTADINTTLPYALMIFFMIQYVAVRQKGIKYFAHVTKPFWFLTPINILEELARPATLCARLFFNIFVGELLFVIIASIIQAGVMIGAINLSLLVTVVPFFIQFFNFFVGTIQAFVFTLLGIVYLSLAISDDH